MSEFNQIGDEESTIDSDSVKDEKVDGRTGNTGFRSPDLHKSSKGEGREGMKVKTICEKNESQEELRDEQSIVVSKKISVQTEWK